MKYDVIDQNKKKVGEVTLDDAVFSAEPNEALIYENIKMQLASRRAGTASTMTVTNMKGTTAKVYRQKGTGNARHGSLKRNIFVGGAKAHGPNPRDYSYRMPKKARRAALKAALAQKVKDQRFLVVEDWKIDTPKTKPMVEMLTKWEAKGALFVTVDKNENFEKSVRNIPYTKVILSEGVNVYDLIRYDYVVFTKPALEKVQEALKS